jgi:hypothetical protein
MDGASDASNDEEALNVRILGAARRERQRRR